MESNSASGWTQVARGLAFGALCAYAIRTDIANNLNYFGPINAEFAGITVAAAICIAILPWKRWGALKGVCLALTCWAAAAAYANSLGLDIARNADAGKSHASAVADSNAARATLARITETADAATLETMTATAKAKADAADQLARERMGSDTGCQQVKACREAGAAYTAVLDRLSQAKARDAAHATLAKAEARADHIGTAKVDVLAVKVSSALGTEYESTAQAIAIVLAVLAIAATQGAALLGHTALSLIGDGIGNITSNRRIKSALKAAPKAEGKAQAKSRAKKATHKLTKPEALAVLRAHINERGNKMVARPSQIAKLFPGVSRNTVCGKRGWLAQWVRDGEIAGDITADDTTIWRTARKVA